MGREIELDLVDLFLARLPGGTPILVIEGDPGIGKTTVWLEAIRRAQAKSFRVLRAGPAESEAIATAVFSAHGHLGTAAGFDAGSGPPCGAAAFSTIGALFALSVKAGRRASSVAKAGEAHGVAVTR
jgi:hypothetical protein